MKTACSDVVRRPHAYGRHAASQAQGLNHYVQQKYAIGVDFGTESGRALLVDVADGRGGRHRRPSPTPTA